MARVMIIDGTLEHVRVLVKELKSNGHETMGFLRGDKALEAHLEFKPDLVICEWRLADKMKGWEVAHQLGKIEHRPYMVALHQFPSRLKTAISFEFGFNECATKPLKVFTLLTWAARAIKRAQ